MKRVPLHIGRLARIGWDMLGITLLIIICVELFSQAVLHVAGRDSSRYDSRIEADAYLGDDWPADYYHEYTELRARWDPYTYWRMMPFDGDYIGVDDTGLRLTSQSSDHGAQVFMFGGSTLWGIGARDEYTIPSQVAATLARADVDVQMSNYGEIGFVSTQEVLRLLIELRRGNVPDVVIFYDGINDITSAIHSGTAGIPQNEYRRRAEFNLLSRYRFGDLNLAFAYRWVDHSASIRLTRAVMYRFSRRKDAIASVPTEGRSPLLAREVMLAYRDNVELVRLLADQYGFTTLFYWQPVIFYKDTLTDYEITQRVAAEKYRAFFESCYDVVRSGMTDVDGFHDLSMLFSGDDTPYYVDFMHVGEAANHVVAERIANDLSPLVKQ